ncbi:MAG: hypothetical protein J7K68_03515 [Candidatus Diapherotrites archaeon]|nr:hypothetical protein [Candidatus Diapherotrites archaeon]
MQKGISSAMSYVMILAIVVVLSVVAYTWGNYELTRLGERPIAHNVESQFITVDQLLQNVAHGDINFTTSMELYYPKGIVQVDETKDWIKYTGQINANVYESEVETSVGSDCTDKCTSSCTVIYDSVTKVKMSKIPYTNVYRGRTGDARSQFVEIVICTSDIDLVGDQTCIGKSGPRAMITLRKSGYSGTEPEVTVRIC